MTLIDKTGSPIPDNLVYSSGEGSAELVQNSVVYLSELERYRGQFGREAAGVWVTGDQDADEILPVLKSVAVVVVEFPKSRDGRGFSLGRLLRERHNFKGDIRAAGPLLPDQFSMLIQCGFTTLISPSTVPLGRWKDAGTTQSSARPRTLLERLTKN